MQIQPYLFFDGRCEEAIEFYRKTLDAKVEAIMRYKDNPDPAGCAGPAPDGEKVMHACLHIGNATILASDGMAQGKPDFKGFSLALSATNDAQAERWFAALSNGGEIQMPMDKTFFSSRFGMVADRFGVSWMVLVASDPPQAGT